MSNFSQAAVQPPSRFNIALFPDDPNLIDTCIRLADANFEGESDEYILGQDAWPHVTLCQIQVEADQIPAIWSSVKGLRSEPLLIRFNHIYILPGCDSHSGKYWVGLAVKPESTLLELQKATCDQLLKQGIESLTTWQNYFPHLTWARLGQAPDTITSWPDQELWQNSHSFRLTLGRSDENGIYQERLFPDAQ